MNEPQGHSDRVMEAVRNAALSGSGAGALLGLAARVFSGSRNPLELAKAAAIGGGLSGSVAGGSTWLGSQMLGAPGDDETNPYTRRAALGGAVGGGLLGAGAGALVASGLLNRTGVGKALKAGIADNIIGDQFFKLGAKPTLGKTLGGAAAGGGLGGALAGYMAADEGMGVDIVRSELEEALRRRGRERVGLE